MQVRHSVDATSATWDVCYNCALTACSQSPTALWAQTQKHFSTCVQASSLPQCVAAAAPLSARSGCNQPMFRPPTMKHISIMLRSTVTLAAVPLAHPLCRSGSTHDLRCQGPQRLNAAMWVPQVARTHLVGWVLSIVLMDEVNIALEHLEPPPHILRCTRRVMVLISHAEGRMHSGKAPIPMQTDPHLLILLAMLTQPGCICRLGITLQ